MKVYLTELVGTFFLTLVVALSGGEPLAPLAIGGILAVLVYAGGYISGAHYNPAVTIAVALSRALKAGRFRGIVLSQIVGATSASLIANGITGSVFAPSPTASILFAPLLVEILFTMLLCYVVLHTAVAAAAKNNQYYGLAIGGALMIAAIVAGPISGAVLNPAAAIGAFLASILSGNTMQLSALLLYLLAPITGAVASAVLFGIQRSGKDPYGV